MKLKNFIGMCITCFAVVSMATIAHAEHYAIGGANGHVDGTNHSDTNENVNVPVMVIPDENTPAHVNGYIMSFTYDSSKATPNKTSDVNSPYASMGSNFSNGIMVSDIVESIDKTKGDSTLIIAWAAQDPVEVLPTAEKEEEIMANISFHVSDSTIPNIPVHVEMAQLVENASGSAEESQVKTPENGGIENGQIFEEGALDLNILRGDANGDGKVRMEDASLVAEYAVQSIPIGSAEINLNNSEVTGDGNIKIEDAALIAEYVIQNIKIL